MGEVLRLLGKRVGDLFGGKGLVWETGWGWCWWRYGAGVGGGGRQVGAGVVWERREYIEERQCLCSSFCQCGRQSHLSGGEGGRGSCRIFITSVRHTVSHAVVVLRLCCDGDVAVLWCCG